MQTERHRTAYRLIRDLGRLNGEYVTGDMPLYDQAWTYAQTAAKRARELSEETGDKAHYLERLAVVQELAKVTAQLRADAIQEARLHGASWADIGAKLGISKQAAQQRFGQ